VLTPIPMPREMATIPKPMTPSLMCCSCSMVETVNDVCCCGLKLVFMRCCVLDVEEPQLRLLMLKPNV
jgi:hypothetical protein